MGPKLQIPFNVYGVMAITRQSILALLPLSLPLYINIVAIGTFRKMGFKQIPTFREEPRT